jgi:hypothetical protein
MIVGTVMTMGWMVIGQRFVQQQLHPDRGRGLIIVIAKALAW